MRKTYTSKGRTFRLALILSILCFLSLVGVVFIPAPLAHAAGCSGTGCDWQMVNGSGCGNVQLVAATQVSDTYKHVVGTIRLHYSLDCNTYWATFLSNTNTWKSITVVTFGPGYYYRSYGTWRANTNFDAPMAFDNGNCIAAHVYLTDNNGQPITAWTSQHGSGCP